MSLLLQNIQNRFIVSAEKVAYEEAAESIFEKFHFLTLDYRTPIVVSILYVLVVSFFSRLNRQRAAAAAGATGSSSASNGKRIFARNKKEDTAAESRFTPFKCLVIAHNVFLCLYSAVTFVSVLPLIVRPYFSSPIIEAFCDVQKKTFNSGVHFWVWNFYVSKYYELVDTAILLLKGKPSSFLQTFHHSGSIIGMWIMTTTHAPAAWIFVLFNSFIHTVMYFYYTLTCFGYRPSWKKILTTMQIIQFVVGNPLGLIYAFLPDCIPIDNIPPENVIGKLLDSQLKSLYACLFVNTFFISSLIVLFTDFSRKTYGKKDNKKPLKVEKITEEKPVKKVAKKSPVTEKPEKKSVTATEKKTSSTVKSIKAVKEEPAKKTNKKATKEIKETSTVTRRSRRT